MQIKLSDIECEVLDDDNDPDTSWIGEYSNNWQEGAIERERVGFGEYRYFIPAMTGEETGNPESPRQDYERMEALNNGEWHFVGIRAMVKLVVNGRIQEFTSPGLWGIESDIGEDYFTEVFEEEKSQLVADLRAMGFEIVE